MGGVLSYDAHVLGERGHGLDERGGVHPCKWVAIPNLENGFLRGTKEKRTFGIRLEVFALRPPVLGPVFAFGILGSVS